MFSPRYRALALIVLVLAAAISLVLWQRQPPPQEQLEFHPAGVFQVGVSVEPQPPVAGSNHIHIEVRDAQGEPVSGAQVKALAEMPAMGAMPAMRAQADIAETAPGVYEGDLELSMAGEWPLAVEVVKGEYHADLTFALATGRTGLALATATPTGDISYYTCPMHPSVKAAQPGACPICGMDLVAVERETLQTGGIVVDEARRQLIGVMTGVVERKPFVVPLRLQGRLVYDPARLTDISLRFDGWIGDLSADFVGKRVKRGDILFTVYSPELLSLQDEFLQVLARRRGGDALVIPARKRLQLWGLNDEQIDWLARRDKAEDYVPIFAPRDGVIVAAEAVNGSAFRAGERLLRLADLSQVWVEAHAYEKDLPLIQTGMEAQIQVPASPNINLVAQVMQVDPFVDPATRTALVRLQVDNTAGRLKPGGFVAVQLDADLGEHLVVPEDAVLISGDRRIVFRDLGDGRLQPQAVITGPSNGEEIMVLDGLEEGDHVVTSGNFLIASESRLRGGLQQW